jgi:hypothetical protein
MWRDLRDAQRAYPALALAEHATCLAVLALSISLTNIFNRLNVTTAQVADAWG